MRVCGIFRPVAFSISYFFIGTWAVPKPDDTYCEAQAAAMLPGRPSARTLKRWRLAGHAPHCRTPGGRIFYTFEQLVEIGAAMRRRPDGPACPSVAPGGTECPDMSGETAEAAE